MCRVGAETCHLQGQLLMALVLGPNVFVYIDWPRQSRYGLGEWTKGPQESGLTASQGV